MTLSREDLLKYKRDHYWNNHEHYMKKAKEYRSQPDFKLKSYKAKRDYHLRKRYKISVEDYSRLLIEQNGGCKICGFKPVGVSTNFGSGNKKEHLCVDHSHKTGKVRGLVCHRCNIHIAHAEHPLNQKVLDYIMEADRI